MAIFLPRRWNRQPQYPTAIDWGNPLTRGLVGSWTPPDNQSLGGRAYVVGNIASAANIDGRSWRGAYQASNNYVRVDRTAAFAYTTQVTFEALVRVAAFQTTVFPYITGVISQFQSTAAGAAYSGPILRFNADAAIGNAARPAFIILQSGVDRRAASTTSLSIGITYHLLGTYDGANVTLYVNGVQAAQTAATGSFDNDANNFISLASDYVVAATTHNRCLNGDLFLARIYNQGKTAAEVAELARNPWQLFRPAANQTFYSLPSQGTAYSLSLDAGSYALTGRNVDLTSARSLGLDAGSYALTGRDVTLVYSAGTVSYTLSLDAGSYSLTGRDVGTSFGRSLALDSGTYNLSGQPITFNVTLNMLLDSGAYNLTGRIVGLTWSGETPVEITDRIITLRSLTERWRM